LFSKGKSFSVYPVKVLYDFVPLNTSLPLQGGLTVSSRNFKKAVERNRVKRILREAYRLNKLPLQEDLNAKQLKLAVFFIYTARELPVFEEISLKMIAIMKRLSEVVSKQQVM